MESGLTKDAATFHALEPGTPVPEGHIALCAPEIRGNEWKYIKECLDSGWVSSVGPFVDRFERELAARIGCRHAVAVASGTAALHIALLVAGVEPHDEVLVSALTFVAPVNAIRYVGAWPVFMDAEPLHWQMDPQRAVDFLENECRWQNGELRNAKTGRRLAAILPVHILGHPCDMDPLLQVARKFNLVVIEDATESLGAKYKGRMVGHLGDIACFSFNGNKIITAGGGGMVVTDDEGWAGKARYLSTQSKDDPVEFIHNEIGYNYRLTNIQAAMGCAQIEKLDDYIGIKRRIADRYSKSLTGVPGLTFMNEAEWAFSTHWMSTILVDKLQYGMSSRELMANFEEAGIQTRPLWRPIYSLPPYAECQSYQIQIADQLCEMALHLPSSVGLSQEDQQKTIAILLSQTRSIQR